MSKGVVVRRGGGGAVETLLSTATLEELKRDTHVIKSNLIISAATFATLPNFFSLVLPNVGVTHYSKNSNGNYSSWIDFYHALTFSWRNGELSVYNSDSDPAYNKYLSVESATMAGNFEIFLTADGKIAITNLESDDRYAIAEKKFDYAILSYLK